LVESNQGLNGVIMQFTGKAAPFVFTLQ